MSGFSNSLMLTPLKAPCRYCDHRHKKCHSTCNEYKEFNRANETLRQEKLERIHIADTLHRNEVNRLKNLQTHSLKLKHGRRGA